MAGNTDMAHAHTFLLVAVEAREGVTAGFSLVT
jgi:hypothetical protein